MRRVNAFNDDYEHDSQDPDGYRAAAIHVTKALGAASLAVKVFDLPPGESLCPYHYEYEEEWLLVLEGTVMLRRGDGAVDYWDGER
jgi:uncharacterized cupin superfamily protein